jgi:hypothetical protein
MPYSTAELDARIAKLEDAASKGFLSVMHEGNALTYKSMKELREAIVYFQSLYKDATDAPTPAKPRVRRFLCWGGDI